MAAESLSDRLLGSTEQAEVINQVVAGVRETFGDSGIDQAVLNRLEKLWVSKLMDRQQDEGAWQPANLAGKTTTATGAGKTGVNLLPANIGGATAGRNTAEMPAKKSRKVSKKGVRERWEQAPKKAAVGNAEADLKVKKLEVKIKETNLMGAKGAQSEESRARSGKKKDEYEATEVESLIQLDGNAELNGSSDDDDELGLDDDSDDEDSEGSDDESSEDEGENLGDELGSDDDISDEDASELFDTSNVVVCQYDRISKARNKWKFNLKNGVMNLDGRDYTFLRATGEAVW